MRPTEPPAFDDPDARGPLGARLPLRQVWQVAALVHAVADTVATRFGAVTVRGELVNVTRASSGHCYFTLKDVDGSAGLRCAMFRRAAALLAALPADGDEVEVRGRVAVYEPRGELQLVVESLSHAGAGALYERFLRLKAQLQAEGLFDSDRKRPLPTHPRCIGVVTSTAGAALHDVLTTLARRAPQVRVVVYPSLVQGPEAPAALVAALTTAARRREADVLLLVRGGGSLEDLWAFNDAGVVRAVAESPLPLVCGVGHETDVTLADLAADVRAPTPTAAAELAAPVRAELLAALQGLARRQQRAVTHRLDGVAQRLDRLALRLARPSQVVGSHRQRLSALADRLRAGLQRRLADERLVQARLAQRWQGAKGQQRERAAQRLDLLQARLQAVDPQRVLTRGYAWLGDAKGRAIVSVHALRQGDAVEVRLADGRVEAEVRAVQPDGAPPTGAPKRRVRARKREADGGSP